MSKEIRWGMIGCGDVTEEKSGAPAFKAVDGAKLMVVMSRSDNEVADYAARHEVPSWTTDAEKMINDATGFPSHLHGNGRQGGQAGADGKAHGPLAERGRGDGRHLR